MNVWLAEHYLMGFMEKLGVFSDPVLARETCQDIADGYFGAAQTAPLTWLGDDGHASASHHHPVNGMQLFQITRFTVDEVNEVRLVPVPFDFRGTALELCSRSHCCHYRGEHEGPDGSCNSLGRGADGFMDPTLPGCSCPGFVGEPSPPLMSLLAV